MERGSQTPASLQRSRFESMHERFLDLEVEQGLFAVEIDGAPFWDYMRTTVRDFVVESLEFFGEKHSPVDRSPLGYLRETRSIISSLLRANPYRCSQTDLLFIGHQRRKLEPDGLWWDPYCDPIVDAFNTDSLILERPFHNRHQRPAKTKNLAYLDMLSLKATLAAKRRPFALAAQDREYLDKLAQVFQDQLQVSVPLAAMTEARLAVRRSQFPYWQGLFRKIKPKLLFVVVSYGNEIPIEAAQSLGIPTVEIQHGVVSNYHLGYSYERPSATKRLFPDYLLLFGEFWRGAAKYPIPDDQIFCTGFPYFEAKRKKTTERHRKRQLLILSQRSVGVELSRLAAQLAAHPDVTHEIVYKLHPGELATWKADYPWLRDAPLRVMDDQDTALYDLFAESSVQLGSYSTAIYEGLAFGLQTLIETLPGSESMDHLVHSIDSVTRTEGLDSIVTALQDERSYPPADIDHVFVPDSINRLRTAIQSIRQHSQASQNQ